MVNERSSRYRLALLTNMVAPYRVPVFQGLAERFDLLILLSGTEANRPWDQSSVPGVRTKTVWGFTIRWKQVSSTGQTDEERYAHINLGYIAGLQSFRPHAVISGEMGFRSLIAVLYGSVFRIPVFIWWEGGIHSSRQTGQSFLQRFMRRYFFAKVAKNWISFGNVSTTYLRSLGVNAERICQVQSPVDERTFAPTGDVFPLHSPHPRVLCVSRLVARKGIHQLLDAVHEMWNEGHRFSLILVGDGPERDTVAATIDRLEPQEIQWLRWVATEDMPSVYRACDFMVFPTLGDTWGLVVNEALLSGIPVIASIYAGSAEELLPPENLFDPLNPESFQDALRRALNGSIALSNRSHLQPFGEVVENISVAVTEVLAS